LEKSHVIRIKDFNEYIDFKKHRRGIIFYGAKWCGACDEIKPAYLRISNHYYKRIHMAYVNIDDPKLDFSVIPVFVTFRKGKQLNSMEGADKEGLKKLIKDAILAP